MGWFTLFTIVAMFLLYELTSSIGMCVYFKKAGCKYPALVFVPLLKYYYFSKHSFGFCPIEMNYRLPNILLPILYILAIAMFFVGLDSFVISFGFFAFYIGCIYRGIYLHYGYKDLVMLTALSATGFPMPLMLHVASKKVGKEE